MQKGLNREEAEIAAYKRARAEKIVIACAATAMVAVSAYIAANEIDRRTDKIVSDSTEWKRIASTDSKELHDVFYSAHGRDVSKYEGLYGVQKGAGEAGNVYQKTIRTAGLRIASEERARNALSTVLSSDSASRNELAARLNARANNPFLGQKQRSLCRRAVEDLKAGRVTRSVYDAFNSDIANTSGKDATSQRVFSVLKKQGFHAIEDVNDKRYSGYAARSATIIFDKSRATVESVRTVPTQEIRQKAAYEMLVINGKSWVKSRTAIAGTGVAIGAGLVARTTHKENSIVAQYRKEHPNTNMSYEQILRSYYANN